MIPRPRPRVGQIIDGPYPGQSSIIVKVRAAGTIDVEVTRGPGAGEKAYRLSGIGFLDAPKGGTDA